MCYSKNRNFCPASVSRDQNGILSDLADSHRLPVFIIGLETSKRTVFYNMVMIKQYWARGCCMPLLLDVSAVGQPWHPQPLTTHREQ